MDPLAVTVVYGTGQLGQEISLETVIKCIIEVRVALRMKRISSPTNPIDDSFNLANIRTTFFERSFVMYCRVSTAAT